MKAGTYLNKPARYVVIPHRGIEWRVESIGQRPVQILLAEPEIQGPWLLTTATRWRNRLAETAGVWTSRLRYASEVLADTANRRVRAGY